MVHYFLLGAASVTAVVSLSLCFFGKGSGTAAISKAYAEGSKVITSPSQYALVLGVVSTLLIVAGFIGVETMAAPQTTGQSEDKVTLAATAFYMFAILTSIPLMLFTITEAAVTLSVAKSASKQAKVLLACVIATTSVSTISGTLALASGSFECFFGQPREQ